MTHQQIYKRNDRKTLSRRPVGPSQLFGVLALLMIALVGCSQPAAEHPKTAVIGTTEDFEAVNELIAEGSSFNSGIIHRIFLQLVSEQADSATGPATFEPRLASSWEFSEDRLALTFELRDDVLWSDGEPVTAEDVRFSWQAHTSPEVEWSYAFTKRAILDVEVLDDHRVRFHFTAASATQLEDVNEGVVLPEHVWSRLPFVEWRQQPQWFSDNLVTSGPFLLESWRPQQRLTLVRNPNYFETGLPKLERVVFQFIPEPANLVSQFLSGDLDLVPRVSPADAARIEEHPDLRLLPYKTRQFTFITWNTLRPEFAKAEVRRALALAIDRATIVDTLWHGHAKVGSSPIVSTFWAYNDKLVPWAHDPEEARRILDAHGWIDRDGDGIRERDGEPFSFELTTNPGDQTRWDAMQMIRAQLSEVGIEVLPRRIEYKALNVLNLDHDYDATVTAFLMDTTLDLSYAFHSDAAENGYNFGAYKNAEVDRLIEEVNAQLDPRNAEPLLHRIQEILHQEQPVLFLWEPDSLVAARVDLENVYPNMISEYFNMREWSKVSNSARD